MVSEVKGPSVSNIANLQATQNSNAQAPASSAANGSPDDPVTLTDLGTRLQKLTEAVASLPVVDQQRVAELRQAVESGSYQVDSKEVAKKLTEIESLLTPPSS